MTLSKIWTSICFVILLSPSPCLADWIELLPDGEFVVTEYVDEDVPGTTKIYNGGFSYSCRNDDYSFIPCAGLGTESLNVRCSIDGEGNPVNENGTMLSLIWSRGNLVDELGYSEHALTYGTAGHQWKVDFVPGLYTGRSEFTAVCTMDLTGINAEVRTRDGVKVTAPSFSYNVGLRFRFYYGVEISRPGHVRAQLGDTLEFPFTMRVHSRYFEGNYELDWSINEPCDGWAPQLQVRNDGSGGTVVLTPNNIDSTLIAGNLVNELKMSVTPDRVGEFQCVGTLTLTPD